MPPQAGQQGGDANGPLWLSALGIISVVVIWYIFHEQISFFVLKLKLWESYLFNPFTNQFAAMQALLGPMSLEDAKNYNVTQLDNISTYVGNYMRFVVIAILGVLAALLYFGSNCLKYRNIYSIQRLITDEQKNWPFITSVINVNIDKIPLDEHPWAMSLTPMLFAKKYDLLEITTIMPDSERISTDIRLVAALRKAKAKQFFFMQLGSYWHGPDSLPIYAKALFAMFAAKNNGDKDAVTALNRQISASAAGNSAHINFNGVDPLLAKYRDTKGVQKICGAHAFNYTVMAAMLEFARKDGVYATADFLWLKPLDRRLWYILNSVGRKTPFPEVAGIFSHFQSEVAFGRKILTPMVDSAVTALEVALSEVIYKPDET